MQSQDDADILQLKRRKGGDLIAVGLPHDSAIFVQEYWDGGTPFYAIANASDDVATVSVAEWSGAAGRRLVGPWPVAPKAVRRYDIRALLSDYSGPLLAISLNENPVHGLLKSPELPRQADAGKPDSVLTTYGLNGIGDRYAHISFVQERLVQTAGRVVSLGLKVPENTGVISFKTDGRVGGLPQALIVGATSDTSPVWARGDSYNVGAVEFTKAASHEVRLEVKLPEVETEFMAALLGHVACQNGAGFYFARGLVVAPRTGRRARSLQIDAGADHQLAVLKPPQL